MATETIEQVKERIEEVTPEEARKQLESGDAVLVDTRDAINREDVRIEGDAYAPAGAGGAQAHSEDFAELVAEAAGGRDKRVILYCNVGNRSAVAADALKTEHGFSDVASVAGGIGLWEQQGLPVVTPEGMSARAAQPLLAAHAAARGRGRGPAEDAERQGAADRRRRARRSLRALPGRGRDRHAGPRRRRRGRRVEPAAPGDPQHRAHRDAEDGVGAQDDRGAQPRRQGGRAPHPPRRLQHHRPDLATTT